VQESAGFPILPFDNESQYIAINQGASDLHIPRLTDPIYDWSVSGKIYPKNKSDSGDRPNADMGDYSTMFPPWRIIRSSPAWAWRLALLPSHATATVGQQHRGTPSTAEAS